MPKGEKKNKGGLRTRSDGAQSSGHPSWHARPQSHHRPVQCPMSWTGQGTQAGRREKGQRATAIVVPRAGHCGRSFAAHVHLAS